VISKNCQSIVPANTKDTVDNEMLHHAELHSHVCVYMCSQQQMMMLIYIFLVLLSILTARQAPHPHECKEVS
jgi:hypothetical protein